jgi:signal transduction histidine kinase
MGRLRPPVLDDYGLVASLRWYGDQFSKRTGIPVELRDDGGDVRLPADSETALFRVVQEAMANVAKHAKATQVLITIACRVSAYRVTVTDDGSGFDPNRKVDRGDAGGWGLLTMKERARSVGGQFAVRSSPGDGTQVVVEVESVCRSN